MKTHYLRMKSIIRTINEDGTFHDEDLKSINAAKRKSSALQKASGGLGRGSLRVVEKFPKLEVAHV